MGFFLQIPVPPPDMLAATSNHREMREWSGARRHLAADLHYGVRGHTDSRDPPEHQHANDALPQLDGKRVEGVRGA